MRVHFAALPAKSKADDGFGGAAIAAAGSGVGCVAGGAGGGGPHITRFIVSAMLCLLTCGAALGTARTLDHGQINSSVPMGYM